MNSLVFDSNDLSLTEDFLSRAYSRLRIGHSGTSGIRTRIRREAMPSVTVDELDFNYEMSYEVEPLGKITLCTVHEGTIADNTFHGVKDTYGPGDIAVLAPPEQPYSGRVCSTRYNAMMMDTYLLNQVADAEPSGAPVRLTAHRPHSPAAARQLKCLITHLRDQVLCDPLLREEPLIVSASAQMLAASVLAAFPHSARTDANAQDRNDAHTLTLRRALAYIDDHAQEPITIADIAAAAHVTVRALQYAFRRHLDSTPTAHLRWVRLAHAHRDLRAADPGTGITVTSIAARWGFHQPSRFAAAYRAAYGVLPSHSLHT
ncbi:AraC family transcriptional regulator [Streptomyces sp. BH-SS-21]|uniref:AraC family transcriptional regulator n=1 Tax=Streptomyces liliiviolaceus TaxID=2823109 RepID=A0A940Y5E8_9ACTN|nr:helix-turn-helix domain-containing protein [Streptomyces liliiviolaceus]MBQ0855560.1 AraC family transcriptional regulator [Streptomyces liliiviolaceus]